MRRKGTVENPPLEWGQLLVLHNDQLRRVRMCWRQGRGGYRPVVPTGVDLEELDIDLVEEDADFEWQEVREGSVEDHVAEVVNDLWATATDWTRAHGRWCDFQLAGYDDQGQELFADGRRCQPSGGPEPAPEAVVDDAEAEFYSRPQWGRRADSRALDGRLFEHLDRLAADRDNAFDTAKSTLRAAQESFTSVQESIDAAPRLLSKASEVMRETMEYQREQFDQVRDERSGRVEFQSRAFSEMERSRRFDSMVGFLRYGVDATLANIVPIANRLLETLANRDLTVFPEFKSAQQAMAYLLHSLNTTQLLSLWNGNKKAAGGMRALLDVAAGMDNEQEALEQVARLIPLFKSQEFVDTAQPEQQLAARYIIGRMAMYRMGSYAEADTEN